MKRTEHYLKLCIFNDDGEINSYDNSYNVPSWENTNEDENLLEEIGEQLELSCEQCDYETASKADITDHDSKKLNSFFFFRFFEE